MFVLISACCLGQDFPRFHIYTKEKTGSHHSIFFKFILILICEEEKKTVFLIYLAIYCIVYVSHAGKQDINTVIYTKLSSEV